MKTGTTALLSLALSGCALISHGTRKTIDVGSVPAARATLTCDGTPVGSTDTPGKITFKRRQESCNLVFDREGFESKTITLERGPARAFWGNFGLAAGAGAAVFATNNTNLVGLIAIPASLVIAGTTLLVDRLSGAYYDWSPRAVMVTLQQQDPSSTATSAAESSPD